MDKKTIIKGTAVLTFSGIIVKLMGFFYRIYIHKLIGAEGMGLYQLIIPFYMLAFSLTSAGLTTAVSKVTSAEIGKKRIKSGFVCGSYAVMIGACAAAVVSLISIFFADFISSEIIGEKATALSIKILSVSFPFMAAASCMRGVFYGMGKTEIPAVSQIIEQSVRMIVIFLFGAELVHKGIEYACGAAALGMSAGEFVSFLYVAAMYFFNKNKVKNEKCLNKNEIIKMLIFAAVPLTANRTASSLLSGIENMLIPRSLMAFGMSETKALESFGRITGMIIPLVMFPSAFLMALASSVMPVVSEKWASGNKNAVKKVSEKTIEFAVVIGIFAAFLFFTFPLELGYAVYSDKSLKFYIRITALLCPLIYIQSAFGAVLNGLSEQKFIFINGLISSAVMIISVYFIMPFVGMKAFFGGWLLSLCISSFMCMNRIQKRAGIIIDIKGIISGMAKGFIAFMPVRILYDRFGTEEFNKIILCICIGAAFLAYVLLNYKFILSLRKH